jgi:hypothetical protein
MDGDGVQVDFADGSTAEQVRETHCLTKSSLSFQENTKKYLSGFFIPLKNHTVAQVGIDKPSTNCRTGLFTLQVLTAESFTQNHYLLMFLHLNR